VTERATRVAHLIHGLTLGGDAKNLCNHARAQAGWCAPAVGVLGPEPGILACELESAGIAITTGLRDRSKLLAWVESIRPAFLMMHRGGGPDPVETEVVRTLTANTDVPLFEYSAFGRVDYSTAGLWAGHLHVSRASMLRCAVQQGVDPLALQSHAAVGNTLEDHPAVTESEAAEARQQLSLSAKAFVVVRLQRPDLRKWDPLVALAAHRASRVERRLLLLLRAPPAEWAPWLVRLLGRHVRILPPTTDPRLIRATLAASDCLANTSGIGESFGFAIAEAMAAGLPVIVNSTPTVDNAQVELCTHGETGLVANSVGAFAEALLTLARDRDRCRLLGAAGRARIREWFCAAVVEARARRFVRGRIVARGGDVSPIPEPPALVDPYVLDSAWCSHYERAARLALSSSDPALYRPWDTVMLRSLRTADAVLYARHIGARRVLGALSNRLRRGTLRRI
jgi:hypothetical protein